MSDEESNPIQNFHEAVKQLLEDTEYDGFLSDWLLITAQSHVHEDGSTATSLSTFINEHQGIHITAGLAKYAVVKNEQRIANPNYNEE